MNEPTASRRLPKYRRHKPTGQAVVTIDGKDCYLGKHGSAPSKQKYARLIAEWLHRGRNSPEAPKSAGAAAGDSMSVSELILAYVRHCEEYYRDSPVERNKIRLSLKVLRKLYGRSDAAAFGPLALKVVRMEMCKTLARRTVNHRVGVVKRLFKWAVGNEMVPGGSYEALRAVEGLKRGRSSARETEPVKPVADELVAQTLPFLNRHVRAMVEFQRLTGTRSSEVCMLRPCEVDRTGEVWAYRPPRHKNTHRDQDRVIYIGPKAQEVLLPFLEVRADDYVFSPRRMTDERFLAMRAGRKSKVTPSQVSRKKPGAKKKPGERYDAASYYHAVRRACKRAGVDPWHPHQLRHAAATALRKQFGVEVARVILGQRHVNTTELYAQQDGEKASQVMGLLG